MTTVKGILRNPNGVPLAGKLIFALLPDGRFDTAEPNVNRFPFIRTFETGSDGLVNVDVPESQTLGVPYQITFEPSEIGSAVIELLVAIVPKVRAIELEDLIPPWSEDLCARG